MSRHFYMKGLHEGLSEPSNGSNNESAHDILGFFKYNVTFNSIDLFGFNQESLQGASTIFRF